MSGYLLIDGCVSVASRKFGSGVFIVLMGIVARSVCGRFGGVRLIL